MPQGRFAGTEYTPTEEELAALEQELAAQEAVPPPPDGSAYGMGVPASDPAVVYQQQQAVPPPQPAYSATDAGTYSGAGAGVPAPAAPVNYDTYDSLGSVSTAGIDPAYSGVRAADPYAMDQPGSAVGPLSDERYANTQRVSEFQRGMESVPPPATARPMINTGNGGGVGNVVRRGPAETLAFRDQYQANRTADQGGNILTPLLIAAAEGAGGRGSVQLRDSRRIRDNPPGPARNPPGTERPIWEVLGEGAGNAWQASEGLRNALGTATGVHRPGPVASEAVAPPPQAATERPVWEVLGEGVLGAGQATEGLRNMLGAVTGAYRGEVGRPTLDIASGLSSALQAGGTSDARPGALPGNTLSDRRDARSFDTPSPQIDKDGVVPAPSLTLPFDRDSRPTLDFLSALAPATRTAPIPAKANDPLAELFAEEAARNPAVPAPPGGVPTRNVISEEPGAEGTGITFIKANGVYVGARTDDGREVMWGPNATKEQGDAALASLGAAVPVSSSTTPSTPSAVPAPANTTTSSGGSSGGGGGGGWVDYGSTSSSGGSSRDLGSRGGSDFDDFFADRQREFTADDFMEEADGDRTKARALAKAANKKRKRGGKVRLGAPGLGGGKRVFPQREPTPLRTAILAALNESMSGAKKGR